MLGHSARFAPVRRRLLLTALCVPWITTYPVPIRAQEEEGKPHLRKWIGTWNEPNPIVGTRSIITLWEENGELLGTISDPPVPGLAKVRIPFKLQNVKVVDDDTLSWKESGIAVTAKFIPGVDGSAATMETNKDVKGTIAWYLGQKKPHISRFKKE